MITAKVFGFYGVVLSSVEVVLKLRAVGAIAPFLNMSATLNTSAVVN